MHLQIVDVLFNQTLHTRHWNKVQFGAMNKFLKRPNQTWSLVVLTWLRPLQQFFLDQDFTNNWDWNKHGKYFGTITNKLGESTILANIHFCKYSEQQVLIAISTVEAFKPSEGKEGVCTSLEEWALRILKPQQEFQLRGLYENDDETKTPWKRVTGNTAQATFSITNMDFTTASIGSESENKDVKQRCQISGY
jgi:hypothetical protein